MIAIMDAHLDKIKSKTLPFILPLILYTGAKPYKYSTDLFDLFKEHKELARDTLFNPYPLIDLTQVSDEELKKYAYFGAMAVLAKNIKAPDILPILKDMLYLLKDLEKRGELEYIYITLSYIYEAGEVPNKQDFINTVKQLKSVNEEKLMTMAEQFRQEGRQEGEIDKAHKIALKMLKEGIALEKVADFTDLSLSDIKKLKSQIH